MTQIKVLVIPAGTALPVRQEFIDDGPDDALNTALVKLIFGEHVSDWFQPVGYAGFNRTMLAFDEVAGDRDDREGHINPRASELWNHLAAQRGSALTYTDEEPLLGTFVALGRGTGSVMDDLFTDISDEVACFRFKAGA